MAFFRKNLHKITLLLTAVFWANCGAEEKQDIPQKEPVKDSIKTAKQNIELEEFYYGVPFDYQQIIEIIDIEDTVRNSPTMTSVLFILRGLSFVLPSPPL